MWKISLMSLVAVVVTAAPSLASTTWYCVSAEEARQDFADGSAAEGPNYTEGPAARVQRQHPNTGMIGQAKFIDRNGRSAGICQYYNHVGWVYTIVSLDAMQLPHDGVSKWRSEYKESYPEQDVVGHEMMDVCMKERDGAFWPSVGCGFFEPLPSRDD